ncbi:MAG: excinuclease ABC subunit C, partial [Anaerolineae bacterium]|nr:excinuclease ABC subunit C [Anaerolineae bacterium]
CVTTEELFPRVIITRRVKDDGNRYFGPYTNSSALRESLRLIRRAFRIRSCNKKLKGMERDRPCLNQHLEQCESPCSGRIQQNEYASLVRDACVFLEGRQGHLAVRIEREMAVAAEALEFERAARLRDQLQSIRKLTERQTVISTRDIDQDVIAVSRDGGSVCVQLLLVRFGRLIGEDHFFLEGVTDERPEDDLEAFVKEHYRDVTYVPKWILVSHEPAEKHLLEDWLSLKRGSK